MKREHISGRNELIVKLYKSGKNIEELVSMFALSKSRISYILNANGIKMTLKKFTDEQLIEACKAGKTVTECARDFNVTTPTICARACKLGLKFDSRFVSKDDIRKMLDLREDGLSNEQIASRVGYSYQTVFNHIGPQPKEITKNSIKYAAQLISLRAKRKRSAKGAMHLKRKEEARLAELARIEAERKAAEEAARREEEARVSCETSIREILVACGLPSEIHIETSAQGNAILANMKNRFAAATAAA